MSSILTCHPTVEALSCKTLFSLTSAERYNYNHLWLDDVKVIIGLSKLKMATVVKRTLLEKCSSNPNHDCSNSLTFTKKTNSPGAEFLRTTCKWRKKILLSLVYVLHKMWNKAFSHCSHTMIRIKICKVADLLVTPTAFVTFLLMLPSSDFKGHVMQFYSTNHAIMTYYNTVGMMYSVELSMIRTRTEASS